MKEENIIDMLSVLYLILLLILIATLCFWFIYEKYYERGLDFGYPITITNPADLNLTNYSFPLPIVLNNSVKYKIYRDGYDEALPWVSDGKYTWVKIPCIPANSDVTIYVLKSEDGVLGSFDGTFLMSYDFKKWGE